ncbi:hypothetical protein [Stutzerimonas xanthomarina]|uniref:hypothetical protein n=1 Tax=Stutzerimonas xanthomarina TaxID=271420 RepID=UPI0029B8D199|nr:hypothetical protein [Stutzerimonas xanthomarina]MDX2354680.1 hypothetical protein [Stutzerimonas xanthomarina]|tara:strand:+ start:9 stop:527 length:519 start_codon:yes stop_codon:yes gene_type:complete
MKQRWAIAAVTGFTALTAVSDLRLVIAVLQSGHNSWAAAPSHAFLLGNGGILPALWKMSLSMTLLAWWLRALLMPAHRPWLRIANGIFGGWQLAQVTLIWLGVIGILLQVAEMPTTLRNVRLIVRDTDLLWIIPLTLCLPAAQLGLGEWAYRVSRRVERTQATNTIASMEAG